MRKLIAAISCCTLLSATHLLAAQPIVMQLAMPQHHLAAEAFSATELAPLVFHPKLKIASAFIFAQDAGSEGSAIFTIKGPANQACKLEILPQASGFDLDGNTITGTTYPRILATSFGSGIDTNGNFTLGSDGTFTARIGGNLLGFADTLAGLYKSNSNVKIRVTDLANSQSVTIPFNIRFHYLESGNIEAVRTLVFAPQTVTAGGAPISINVNPSSPSSAELDYAPTNATISMNESTVCLTKSGSVEPTGPCGLNTGCGSHAICVSLSNQMLSTSCSSTFGACKAFVGGGAFYPNTLTAGLYSGTGTVTMTYN